jgi:hypothetical protein
VNRALVNGRVFSGYGGQCTSRLTQSLKLLKEQITLTFYSPVLSSG